MDITELILDDHTQQRRMFAQLDDVDRDDGETLAAVWCRLRILLEVHAEAEERHELAINFARFETQHADGVDARWRDPDRYVEQHD